MAWMKVNEIEPIFDSFSKSFLQYLPEIFWTFTKFNEKFQDFMKINKISWN